MHSTTFKKSALSVLLSGLFTSLCAVAQPQEAPGSKASSEIKYRVRIPVAGLVVKGSWPTGPFGPYDPNNPSHPNHPDNPANAALEPSLAPASLAFGIRQAGEESSVQEIWIRNTHSTKTLKVLRVSLEGPAADQYALKKACDSTELAPGESCAIEVQFIPVLGFTGLAAAQVVVESNGDTGSLSSSAAGSSVAPSGALSAPAFGAVNVGSSRTVEASLSNTGIGPLKLMSAQPQMTGDGFSFVETNCESPLPVGGSCATTLQFIPGEAQAHTGSVTWATSGGNVSASLSGSGLQSSLRMTPSAIPGFGKVGEGKSATSPLITLRNEGNGAASGMRINTGLTSSGFAVEGSTCGDTLAAGAQCTFKVRFTPSQPGSFRSELQVLLGSETQASSSLTGSSTNAALIVRAYNAYIASIVGNPLLWGYGVVNGSDKPIKLTSVEHTLSNPSVMFSSRQTREASCQNDVVPAGGTCFLYFLSGGTDGHNVNDYQLTSITDQDNNTYELKMQMWADAVKPVVGPTSSADFGSIVQGDAVESSWFTLSLSSTNNTPATLSWTVPEGFELSESTCPDNSSSQFQCQFKVRFAPTAARVYNDTLTVSVGRPVNGATSFSTGINVRGTAQAMQSPGLQGAKFAGVVPVGASGTAKFSFFNPTASALSVSGVSSSNSAFAVDAGSCSGGVPAGGGCSGTLTFTPAAEGAASGLLQIATSAGTFSLAHSAQAGLPRLGANYPSLDGGSIYIDNVLLGHNYYAGPALTITNTGSAPLKSAKFYSDDPRVGMTANSFGCSGGISAGESCVMDLYVRTTEVGPITANLVVEGPGASVKIPVTVTGRDTAITPKLVSNFGPAAVGSASTAMYRVANDENLGILGIGTATLTGNTQEFTLSKGTTCGSDYLMHRGHACDISVVFTPTEEGQRPPATLSIDIGGHTRTIELSAPPATK